MGNKPQNKIFLLLVIVLGHGWTCGNGWYLLSL